MSTDAMSEWATTLRLQHLELLGPFLVRKEGWIQLFESMPLLSLLITQSPRIDEETIQVLVKNCPNLDTLRLVEIGQLTDQMLPALSHLTHLTHLDLSSPGVPLTDQAMATLLASIGSKLVTLNLGDTGLTDEILPQIAQCSSLQHLSLARLSFTDVSVAAFFSTLVAPGLLTIDLCQIPKLKAKALKSLIKHSSQTLEHLNIAGWKDVDTESLSTIKGCSSLVSLDIGWCRQVTDFTLKEVLDECENIKWIRVWGESWILEWVIDD